MMTMNTEIRELAFKSSTVGVLREAAIRSGMKSLLHDGKRKILSGVTTAREVARFAQTEQEF